MGELCMRIPYRRASQGIRLCLEMPEWSARAEVEVSATVNGGRAITAVLRRGRYQLTAPFGKSRSPIEIALRAGDEKFLCCDGRKRALRMAGLEYLKIVPSNHPKIRRWKDGQL
jgi:hypothetical protein